MAIRTEQRNPAADGLQFSDLITPTPLNIKAGFQALSFKESQFAGLMDPLVMADHYIMTAPTFGPHPHAGISAVSILFEDSEGSFNNRDSLGNHIDLQPGDLYWFNAGRGAIHDEAPRAGAKIHGLQLFVNLPARLKQAAPASLHVPADRMPLLEGVGYRVRLVAGHSHMVDGASVPAMPITMLDGRLQAFGQFTYRLEAGQSVWLYAVKGDVALAAGDDVRFTPQGQAISLRNDHAEAAVELSISSTSGAHFVLIAGDPIRESFVQQGPFVMSSLQELEQVAEAYARGELGQLPQS